MYLFFYLLVQTRKIQHCSASASAAFTSIHMQAVALVTSLELTYHVQKIVNYEHVAFPKVWCRKNVTKKCIRTSESSRCARRSRIKGHRFQLETIPLRRRTPRHLIDHFSLGEITHARRRICHVAIASTLLEAASSGKRHLLAVSGSECATCVETRPRNKDATAATCLNFYDSRSFCF